MYSQNIENTLAKNKISLGDRIKITEENAEYEGLLMPRIGSGDINALVIKLDSGYNIGIEFTNSIKVSLVSKGKKGNAKEISMTDARGEISILGCGGTIASRVEYKTGAVFPAFSPEELITSFPELKEIGSISSRMVFSLLSEDMAPEHWEVMAEEVGKEIRKGARGVVLMHGTDTMHYTSAALSFMLQSLPVPVVLVGAQRSSDRGSSDNQVNLVCSCVAAKSNIGEVTVCMHANMSDDVCHLHRGTRVRKMHTSRRDAFQSINSLPIASISYKERKIEPLSDYKKTASKGFEIKKNINRNVCLVHVYPIIKPEYIDSLSKLYDGVVLSATGMGHVPTNPFNDKYSKSILPNLKGLIDSGIPVVVAPQTLYGRLNLNVYTAGRLLNEIGVIGDQCDWLPEVALVKLMWVLGQTKDMTKVKQLMLTNIANEISDRSMVVP